MKTIDKKTLLLMYSGQIVMSFIYCATSPTIQIYFFQLVDQRTLSFANLLTCALAAIVNLTVPIQRIKEWYRNHFLYIVTVDVFCFCLISYFSTAHYQIRFIGMAILGAISTNLWCIVMHNAINNVIDGDELTDYHSIEKSCDLTASLIGGIVAMIFIDMHVELCILAQCIANCIFGCTDYISFKRLQKLKKLKNT